MTVIQCSTRNWYSLKVISSYILVCLYLWGSTNNKVSGRSAMYILTRPYKVSAPCILNNAVNGPYQVTVYRTYFLGCNFRPIFSGDLFSH